MKRALLALAMAACAPAESGTVVELPPQQLPAPPPPQPQPALVVAAPEPALPLRPGDEWVGTYTCAQGDTDLALHVGAARDGAVDVVFEFSHAPSGASGAFRMRGSVGPNGEIVLAPGPWIRRPPGYVTVGMRGQVRGATFTGRIDGPGCTDFALQRR